MVMFRSGEETQEDIDLAHCYTCEKTYDYRLPFMDADYRPLCANCFPVESGPVEVYDEFIRSRMEKQPDSETQ